MPLFWIWFIVVLISIAIVFLAMVAASYFKEISTARKRLAAIGSQVVETNFGPIEYVRTGKGYPILVIHGAMGGFDQGLWVAKSFDMTKFQIISISRFGYLGSPVPEKPNMNAQADVIAGLLDVLGIKKAAVFGISAGSTSAIRFAARYPHRVSALVLLGPDAPGENYMSVPPRFVFDKLLRSDFLYWAMFTFFGKRIQKAIGLAPEGYTLTPEYEKMVKNIQLGDLPVSNRMDGMIIECYSSVDELFESVTPASPYPLKDIKTPVLVINAADDPISIPENVKKLTEQMPNSRLYIVPDGGHFFFGHTKEVQTEIDQFLEKHTNASVKASL